ncbi:MAG TPA: hypothetical protein VFH56_13375 [Acidimicrobiales bacterium]|nr:hypothetical protein [Acidimicrobiales bacterium]
MFSIFADRSFLASPSTPHAVVLSPFWGTNPEKPPDVGRFDRFAELGSSYLSMTSLDECDVAVFPQNWESAGDRALELAEPFTTACRDAGKTPVVFHGADPTDPPPVDAALFRTSVIRSQRRPDEFAFPAWSEDFLVRYLDGELRPRSKRAKPSIGFCGNTMGGSLPRARGGRLRRRLGRSRPETMRDLGGDHPRTLALMAVGRDPRLEPNFLPRDTFWAGALGDLASLMKARHEYVRNMHESDYVLCVRGIGNFSYRLYETLSMGRIPIFVDTDCMLPLEFDIDWRNHCVWVDASEIDRIGDRVLEFHESFTDSEFEERQRAARRLWETDISPEGFFASFHRHFETS